MGAITSLENTRLAVSPGERITCSVHIRNDGSVVDQFAIDILGKPHGWATVEPRVVNLMPGDVTAVTVTFAPPRSPDVPAGETHFAVQVKSQEDPQGSVVDEGSIEIAAFTELRAELAPTTSHGRRGARHDLIIDNLGNHPAEVELLASDQENRLKFRFRQDTLTAEPGRAVFMPLRVRPEKRFLRGPERKHPFQAQVLTTGTEPVTADGMMIQQQLLPKWLLPVLALLLALVILAVTLWFTVFKPTVQSMARQAAAAQVSPAASAASAAQKQAASAQQQAAQAQDAAAAAQKAAGLTPVPTPKPNGGGFGGSVGGGIDPSAWNPTAFRIVASSAQTANPNAFPAFTQSPPRPANKSMLITDLIIENAAGDAGLIRVQKGDTILLEEGLQNFRSKDYHLGQAWLFGPDEELRITLNCQTAAAGGKCNDAVHFSGRNEN